MPESLKNDDKSIRSYILNDVLEKIPIDKSYENLCKVIGNDAIAFYDFQFWYYRFLSRKQDLDFDRSSEPEPLQFSDLPVDAVGLIVDKLKVVERLMLRRVSKPLREFIEKQVFACTSIDVSFGYDYIRVSYGNEVILYSKDDNVVKCYEKLNGVRFASIFYRDESEVCDDLACVLKNPKLQLCEFVFSISVSCRKKGVLSTFLAKFECTLKSLEHQISVKKLFLQPEHPGNVLAILPYLKSGYLDTIAIDYIRGEDDWKSDENKRKIERIIQLDQWKQAKDLHLRDSLDLFPDEVFGQFKKYCFEVEYLDEYQLSHIGLIFAGSPIFEHCRFDFKDPDVDDLVDYIDAAIGFPGFPGPLTGGFRCVRHVMIPNTDKMLVFKQREWGGVVIEKKTRDAQ